MATAPKTTATQATDVQGKDPTRLVRVIVTCNDPAKREYSGEIFTIGNDVIGTLRKYVAFGAEDGWHIPAMMADMLREKKCQIFSTEKNARGEQVVQAKEINAYTVVELPQLTQEELDALKDKQYAMGLSS